MPLIRIKNQDPKLLGAILEPGGGGGGTGDVIGPSVVLDNELARYNGTTGKIIQGVLDVGGSRRARSVVLDEGHISQQSGDFNTRLPDTIIPAAASGLAAVSAGYLYTTYGAPTNGLSIHRTHAAPSMGPAPVTVLTDPVELAGATEVHVLGDVAYVLTADRLTTVDVRDKTQPTVISSFTDAGLITPRGLDMYQGVAYIGEDSGSVFAVDVGDPSAMILLDVLTQPLLLSGVSDLTVYDGFCYVAASVAQGGLIVTLDVQEPINLAIVGTTGAPQVRGIAVDESVAVTTTPVDSAVHTWSLDNPTDPQLLGTYIDPIVTAGVDRIELHGDSAFICANFSSVPLIVDVNDLSNPILGGVLTDTASINLARKIVVEGDRAYVISPTFDVIVSFNLSGHKSGMLAGDVIEAGQLRVSSGARIEGRLQIGSALDVGAGVNAGGVVSARDVLARQLVAGRLVAGRQAVTAPGVTVSAARSLIAMRGTAQTIQIQSVEIALEGSVFIVKDEAGNATGGTPVTVTTEGAEMIDGAVNATIVVAFGVLRLYSDGVDLFTF